MNRRRAPVWLLLACGMMVALAKSPAPPPSPAEELARAEARVTAWDGPVTGPQAPRDKHIVLIAEDLKNGGILGVAIGVREAAAALGWRVSILHPQGGGDAFAKAAAEALRRKADGVIIAGSDAKAHAEDLRPLERAGVPIVSWHAGAESGPIAGTPVRWNVTTDSQLVARVAATSALKSHAGPAGVVIFTDSRFGIAVAKSDCMADLVRAQPACELLEVCDVPLDKAATLMPEITRKLLARYGARWTHALAINDLYFDHSTPVFAVSGISPESGVACVSAGDGSLSAFMRIRAGLYQSATVAEPLNLQGWQLMDELNRAFAGAPPSGYETPVRCVDRANIAFDGGPQQRFDPDNGYREAYRKIWGR